MGIIITTHKKLRKLIEVQLATHQRQAAAQLENDLLLKQTELLSLQQQINPHFLYNALECLRGRALYTGNDDIAEIADALSSYFRYCINSKSSVVTIADELENVSNYLNVQRFRFGERFSYWLEVGEPKDILLSCQIPHMSIQPILENAISHGLRNTTEDGRLGVKVYPSGRSVVIAVTDNGCGMPLEKLTELNDCLSGYSAAPETAGHNGIALTNINKRIKLYFGEAYGLTVSSIPNEGTQVELLLPQQVET